MNLYVTVAIHTDTHKNACGKQKPVKYGKKFYQTYPLNLE